MSQLSDEIVESQKARSELLKWKAISVAALGAAGLGLSGPTVPQADFALCFIPLVSAYIDLQCRHLSLRIMVIGTYRAKRATAGAQGAAADPEEAYLGPYEPYARAAARKGVFSLEGAALVTSSALLSLGLILLPGLLDQTLLPHGKVLVVSGAIGLILVLTVEIAYRVLRWRIDELQLP